MMSKQVTPENVRNLIKDRELYIWGCGHFGKAFSASMARIGIPVAGYIDKLKSIRFFEGLPVCRPEEVLARGNGNTALIIASFLYAEEMKEMCHESGFIHMQDYLIHSDLKPYHFEIDIAGQCNLKCLTCPRGHTTPGPAIGMMSLDDFKQVIDKLLTELPMLSDVQLYSWGEPLLNKALPEMVEYSKARGLATAVSSNLSLRKDLEPLVKTQPSWFRVSVSGADPDTYAVIHRGGDYNLVRENMYKLAELKAKYSPNMFIEVNYHLYTHNLAGVKTIASLCTELGFTLRTNYAFIDPVDMVMDYAADKPVSPLFKEAMSYLQIPIDEAITLSKLQKDHDCVSQNSFVIHSDLSFRRCTHLYGNPDNIMSKNFLKTPLAVILDRVKECSVCKQCRELGAHRYHFMYLENGTEI